MLREDPNSVEECPDYIKNLLVVFPIHRVARLGMYSEVYITKVKEHYKIVFEYELEPEGLRSIYFDYRNHSYRPMREASGLTRRLTRAKLETVRHLLGTKTDSALAKICGVKVTTLARYRRNMEVPSLKENLIAQNKLKNT